MAPIQIVLGRMVAGAAVLLVVMLVAPWNGSASSGLSGQMACLAGAACYGAAFTYSRRFVSAVGVEPGIVAAGQLTIGSLVLIVAAPFVAAQPVDLSGRVVLS